MTSEILKPSYIRQNMKLNTEPVISKSNKLTYLHILKGIIFYLIYL
jgi:hypothetical protein